MSDYMIARYGNGGFVVIPAVVSITIPVGRYASAGEVVDALFTLGEGEQGEAVAPLNAVGLRYAPFPGCDRLDVGAFDLTTGDTFDVEIGPTWARFYLRPERRDGDRRVDLEGQPLLCADVVAKACAITGGTVHGGE